MSIQKRNKSFARSMLLWLLAFLGFMIVVHLTLQALNWLVYYQQHGQIFELTNRFDFEDEVSLPSWFSQILLLSIGLLALLVSYLERVPKHKRWWGIIGIGGVLISLDEGTGFHEYILQTIHVTFFKDASPTSHSNAWLIVLPFVTAAASWFTYRLIQVVPRNTLRLFVIAGSLYLIGAIGIDLTTSLVARETFLNQGILVAAEESLEILGTILFFYAVLQYTEQTHGRTIKKAFQALKNDT